MKSDLAMFTVDLEGDWGSSATRAIHEVLPRFLELLQRYGVTATFFVVAELVSHVSKLLTPEGPHEIGSHGLTHTPLTQLDTPSVAHEIKESKRILEAEGYRVAGFRAPYFKSPPEVSRFLEEAGYAYDASEGSVYPRLPRISRQMQGTGSPLPRVTTSTLRDRCTPFSLTYLRLYHPFGVRLISPDASLFYCHLHELLDSAQGWRSLPAPLRKLHQRNSGAAAWDILGELLNQFEHRFVSCQEYLDKTLNSMPSGAT